MGYCVTHRKSVFYTEDEALQRLAEIKADPHTEIIPVRAYFDPECQWWHITSTERSYRPVPVPVPPAPRPRRPAGEVTISYRPLLPLEDVHWLAVAKALELAYGDERRLIPLNKTTVLVINQPREEKP